MREKHGKSLIGDDVGKKTWHFIWIFVLTAAAAAAAGPLGRLASFISPPHGRAVLCLQGARDSGLHRSKERVSTCVSGANLVEGRAAKATRSTLHTITKTDRNI